MLLMMMQLLRLALRGWNAWWKPCKMLQQRQEQKQLRRTKEWTTTTKAKQPGLSCAETEEARCCFASRWWCSEWPQSMYCCSHQDDPWKGYLASVGGRRRW